MDVASSRGTEAASDVDGDTSSSHKVEPAAIWPARASSGGLWQEIVRTPAGVTRPPSIAALSEEFTVRIAHGRTVAAPDAPRAHTRNLGPRVIRRQVLWQ
eukprot:scaffold11251_cov112-Isochrysis_galbana.AAC.1